jgi:dihydrolipoamide dehydrogenase
MTTIDVTVPNNGDLDQGATLLSWRVNVGEEVARDQILVEVETEKTVIEILSPTDGVLLSIDRAAGDLVRPNEVLGTMASAANLSPPPIQFLNDFPTFLRPSETSKKPAKGDLMYGDRRWPRRLHRGYSCRPTGSKRGLPGSNAYDDPKGEACLGGTCLNVGCIPSKALLASSEEFENASHHLADHGITVGDVKVDVAKMLKRKDDIVGKMTKGIEFLFRKNKVTLFKGYGKLPARQPKASRSK